jgi:hypothetical protein
LVGLSRYCFTPGELAPGLSFSCFVFARRNPAVSDCILISTSPLIACHLQAAVRNDDSLIQLEVFDFQVLNGVGDLLDLMKALSPESIPDFKKMTSQELLMYVHRQGHCSGLIKLLPGNPEELIFVT